MRPCLVKLQSSFLGEFQIVPIYRILMGEGVVGRVKNFCMERSSALSSRLESPPYTYHLPSGLLL